MTQSEAYLFKSVVDEFDLNSTSSAEANPIPFDYADLFLQTAAGMLATQHKQSALKKDRLTLRASDGRTVFILVDYSKTLGVKVQTSTAHESYVVWVHDHVLKAVFECLAGIWADKTIMSDWGDVSRLDKHPALPKVVPRGLETALNIARGGRGALTYPTWLAPSITNLCPNRKKLLKLSVQTAFAFITLHEIAHLTLGHVRGASALGFVELDDEVRASDRGFETDRDKLSHAMELHADHWSISQILRRNVSSERLAVSALGLVIPLFIFRMLSTTVHRTEDHQRHPALWMRGFQLRDQLNQKDGSFSSDWFRLLLSVSEKHPLFSEWLGPILQNDQHAAFLENSRHLKELILKNKALLRESSLAITPN